MKTDNILAGGIRSGKFTHDQMQRRHASPNKTSKNQSNVCDFLIDKTQNKLLFPLFRSHEYGKTLLHY